MPMTDPAALLCYIEIAAATVDLTIAPEHLDGVVQALAVLLEQGAVLMNFPIDEAIEYAPQYRL